METISPSITGVHLKIFEVFDVLASKIEFQNAVAVSTTSVKTPVNRYSLAETSNLTEFP